MARILLVLDKIIEKLVMTAMLFLVVFGGIQVFSRYFLNYSLTWSDEVSRYLLIWLVFLNIGVALRKNLHIGMNSVVEKLPIIGQKIVLFITVIIEILVGLAIFVYSIRLVNSAGFQTTPALGIPISFIYFGMVIGGGYIVIVGIDLLVKTIISFTKGAAK